MPILNYLKLFLHAGADYLKEFFSSVGLLLRLVFALVLAVLCVYEGIALLSTISAIVSGAAFSDSHLKIAIFATIDILVMLLSGYGAFHHLRIIKKCAR